MTGAGGGGRPVVCTRMVCDVAVYGPVVFGGVAKIKAIRL